MKEKKEKSRGTLIRELLQRNVAEIIDGVHLKKQLLGAKKLRVKLGIDPTSPNLHLGHLIILRKLRVFQELGHSVVLIIGDFTGVIGDPSGRDRTRPSLSAKEVRDNMKFYQEEAGKILDIKKCEVRYNSEWFGKKDFSFFADLFSRCTVQQVLERDDFQKRLKEGSDISALEMLYSLFQGYDSVAVKADVEVGGTDQKFNILMGRKLQRRFGVGEQDIVTCNLLVGVDGKKKMSKSYANTINFSDAPRDMFGKVMSIPDTLTESYYDLTSEPFIKERKPMEAKKRLAFLIVQMFHGTQKAEEAQTFFRDTFQRRQFPKDAETLLLNSLSDANAPKQLYMSRSELRRLVQQKAVEFEGEKVSSLSYMFPCDGMLRLGKKRFFMVKKVKK